MSVDFDEMRTKFAPFVPALGVVAVCFLAPRLFPETFTGMPLGQWAFGIILGLLAALVAAGMSLIYRTNRIINFAQADLGALPSTIIFSFMSLTSVSIFAGQLGYFMGGLIGLVIAALLGALLERAIVRRFFDSPRLLFTVATIGMSQLLLFAAAIVPLLLGDNGLGNTGQRLAQPFEMTFEFGGITFNSHYVVAAIVAPICLALIALLLGKTDVGVAVRAAADRPDRARLLGIPVKNLHTVIWVIAAVLSFIGAYLRAGMLGIPFGIELSFPTLVIALGALVIGKMEHLPAVTASAAALGILEQAVKWSYSNAPELSFVAIALVILLSLISQRSGTSRRDTEESSSFSAAEEIRAIPPQLARMTEVRLTGILLAVVGVMILLAVPRFLTTSELLKASSLVAFTLIALSVVVLTGWTGQVSLGQMGFASVGAAAGAVATSTWGLSQLVALPIAGLAGAAVAVVIGIPALRLRGLILAIITLAFSLASSNYLLNRTHQSWIPNERLERGHVLFGQLSLDSNGAQYYFALAVTIVLFLAVGGIRRSPVGRRLVAVRDNEKAAAAFATNIVAAKLTAFALSGFLAAIGGSLLVHTLRQFTETQFTADQSLVIFTAAVVGGVTSLAGAVLGAAYLLGGRWFLPSAVYWQLLPTAVGVLIVLTVFPGGLGNLLYRVRDSYLRQVARRHGIEAPSLLGVDPGAESTEAADEATPESEADETVGQVAPEFTAVDDILASLNGTTSASTSAAATNGTADSAPKETVIDYSADLATETRSTSKNEDALLSLRGVDAGYGDIQVLFGVDLDVHEGEIVALLGTNGAGKSTLLNTITGLLETKNGTVTYDGDDITKLEPEQIARQRVAQLPGGKSVFGSLTVRENLRIASWQSRAIGQAARWEEVEGVLEMFPILRERLDQAAIDLSGGQQQMLSLAMVFLTRPRLLMIDELSLGLAPIIVEQLLEIVRRLRDEGMTIVLVEQSVNVALDIADRAYFMEKGQVQFEGSADELLADPDIIRSVYFEGATDGIAGGTGAQETQVSEEFMPIANVAESDSQEATPVEAPPLVLRDISVEFGGIRAVNNASLEVEPGEIVGLIGPNGAGKTTLFDVISGFTPTVGGVVELGGYDLSASSPHHRAIAGIGRSFQDARLFGALTVEETIQVALQRWLPVSDPVNAAFRSPSYAHSEARGRQRVDDLVELLGLGQSRDRFVSELSTGSRRVVDLACILALEPTIVLLDEPSSGIAQREAEALIPLVRRIKSDLGASVLVIEHDMSLITELADRLVALESGRVIASGSADSVLSDDSVVASYLGSDSVHLQRSGAVT